MMETDRLKLRPFTSNDAMAVLAYGSQTTVARAANFTSLRTLRDARSFLAALQRLGMLAIVEKETDKLVGNIGAFPFLSPTGTPVKAGLEVGYALNQDFWGRGYMTEALRALCQELAVQNVQFVRARVYANNQASIRVLEKAGFHRQKERQILDVFKPDQQVLELLYVKMLT